MTLGASRALLLTLLSAFAQPACATAMEPEPPQYESSAGTTSGGGNAGRSGASGTSGGNSVAGTAAHGGAAGTSGGGNGSGGRLDSGGSGAGGKGGAAGSTGNGGNSSGGTPNGGNGTGGVANGGSAMGGSVNQGGSAACDQAAATPLAAMSSNTAVKSDSCLAIQIPADQTWIKKVTLQPEGAMYPLPFTWSNCGTNSSAAFTANYANVVLDSVSSQCPILIKLGGTGTSFNVQWWGG